MHLIHPEHSFGGPGSRDPGKAAIRSSGGLLSDPRMAHALSGAPTVKALSADRARVTRSGKDDLVFGNGKGVALRESKVLTKVLQPAAERAGLQRVTWPIPPHPLVSLNDLNVPVKIAKEQLGDASISTTLNIYTTPRRPFAAAPRDGRWLVK
jgi:integrase